MPCVHAGFLASWQGNGFDKALLNLIWKEILAERESQTPPRVIVTGDGGLPVVDDLLWMSFLWKRFKAYFLDGPGIGLIVLSPV